MGLLYFPTVSDSWKSSTQCLQEVSALGQSGHIEEGSLNSLLSLESASTSSSKWLTTFCSFTLGIKRVGTTSSSHCVSAYWEHWPSKRPGRHWMRSRLLDTES